MRTPDSVVGMLIKDTNGTNVCKTCIFNLAGNCRAGGDGTFHNQMMSAGANPLLVTMVNGAAVINETNGDIRLAHPDFAGPNHFVYMAQGRNSLLPMEIYPYCPFFRKHGLVQYVTLFVANSQRSRWKSTTT